MTSPRDVLQIDTVAIGRKVLVFDQVDSTNSLAAALAHDPKREQLAILTDEQLAGRGQHGRTWTAAPGSSVLLSLLLFPPDCLRRPAILTAWAAVSVCTTIKQLTGVQARIKWPNDVLISDKKVCGTLIEQGRGTVVGIGLNVRQTAQDFNIANLDATSLNQFAAEPLATEHVARTLLQVLDEEYALLNRGELTTLEACWKSHLGLIGKHVIVESVNGEQRGRFRDLTFAGLELEQAGKRPLHLLPEQVQHIQLAGSHGEPGASAPGLPPHQLGAHAAGSAEVHPDPTTAE
jgi:BirA family biotin operon repressor/biotin-[acetyl-CoA-carboxylase] ligase